MDTETYLENIQYIMNKPLESVEIIPPILDQMGYFNLNELIEIKLSSSGQFYKVKETLTRMGILDDDGETLNQVCYILWKKNKYFIIHLNELKKLDGEPVTVLEEDVGIRNLIINLLSEWKLVEIVDPNSIRFPVASLNNIKIVPHKLKHKYKLVAERQIGKRIE